jgi:hypothetical protein
VVEWAVYCALLQMHTVTRFGQDVHVRRAVLMSVMQYVLWQLGP